MFSILKNVVKTAIDVSDLPTNAALDVLTMGGELIDKDKSFLEENIEDFIDDINEFLD